ncbi:hypothetical protein V3851_10265 [Paenibacillus sp. M1]|uniref:SWIM-type domain-containing protein n=1 Tax=Paenibacillus haidiansis TaxID=1574488 RepID=A0ABU7VR15_9BACL
MSRKLTIPKDVALEPVPEGLLVKFPAEAAEAGERPPLCTVLLPGDPRGGEESRALLNRLAGRPLLLAGLLEEGPEALEALLPEQPPWRRGKPAAAASDAPRCSCGAGGCGHAERAMAYGDAAWAADAGVRLALLGWTPETLAAAALDLWAARQPLPDPAAALRQAAGGPERSPGEAEGGPNLAEWLAEMADQGRLHLPGPQLHDVAAELADLRLRRPGVKPGRETGSDSAPWAALLPGVPGAAKGLALVAGRVMERAAELAGAKRSKPG